MRVEKESEKKETKKSFKETLLNKKLVLLNAALIVITISAVAFYNPYFVYFSKAHWIVFLSFIVIGAFSAFFIYYKKILNLYQNLFYVTTVTALLSVIVGNMIDSGMKDVTLLNTSHYKAAGSPKINVRGKIKNTGSMAVKRCELSVTVRVGVAPENQRTIDPEQMFSPSMGLNFNFKSSIFDPDRYWRRTESIVVLDKYFPKKGTAFFNKQLDFGKTIAHPIVRYHLDCQ